MVVEETFFPGMRFSAESPKRTQQIFSLLFAWCCKKHVSCGWDFPALQPVTLACGFVYTWRAWIFHKAAQSSCVGNTTARHPHRSVPNTLAVPLPQEKSFSKYPTCGLCLFVSCRRFFSSLSQWQSVLPASYVVPFNPLLRMLVIVFER